MNKLVCTLIHVLIFVILSNEIFARQLLLDCNNYSKKNKLSLIIYHINNIDSNLVIGEIIKKALVINNFDSTNQPKYEQELFDLIDVPILEAIYKTYSPLISNYGEKYYEIIYKGRKLYIEESAIILKERSYNEMLYLDFEKRMKYKEYALNNWQLFYKQQKEKAKKIKAYYEKNGICINSLEPFKVSEYTEGMGVSFNVINTSKKTIKYINISFSGINPVGDPVYIEKRGGFTERIQCVGPIEPLKSAIYEFEYIWLSDLVEKLKIKKIEIIYMDNSAKIHTNIEKLIPTSDEEKYILYFNE
ncbi:MAG: hypothetical protein SFU91_04920 [Chloroherpetonaceae bacterium]|nr:hypothetical protein [Chloroherpetonaceae bacterium]